MLTQVLNHAIASDMRTMSETAILTTETPYVRRARATGARFRLFCFPHAGAGASIYAHWPALVPAEVEIIVVQLPGREDRSSEQPFTEQEPLIRTLVPALRPYLRGRYGFFGHSSGALLAFELSRALRNLGRRQPMHLFVSGQVAPDLIPPDPPIHRLPDPEFTAAVREIGGTSETVHRSQDLMKFLLPLLRADFTLWDKYRFEADDPLEIPITALGGYGDKRAPSDMMDGWRDQTTGPFDHQLFDGGHFYLNDLAGEVLRTVSTSLRNTAGI
jgi:medium-chain acyl-[acyl-carrier-protein] hydrolase